MRQYITLHGTWIAAQEVMHQRAQRIVTPILTVDIEDVRPVIEGLTVDEIHALHGIDPRTAAKEISLRDENHVGIRQGLKGLAGIQRLDIHGGTVVARAFGLRASVLPLDLDVVLPVLTVHPVHIQAQRTRAEQPLQVLLRLNPGQHEIGLIQYDAQYELRQRQIVPEQAAHKGIVDGAKATQSLQVLFMIAPLGLTVEVCHTRSHLFPCILPFPQAFCKPPKQRSPAADRGGRVNGRQPCFCLCLGFSQMTMTRPLRLMILHFSQIGFTEGLTFMIPPPIISVI